MASLNEALDFAPEKSADIIALDDALSSLAAIDERKCRIIELRFFGGLTLQETAQAVGLSIGAVGRDQRMAEAWLHRELSRNRKR
jgi:RNA polymerase sigma factor (sigma-70 family)